MHAHLYARKSKIRTKRGQLRQFGRSVREQLAEGRATCEDHGWPIGEEYVDDDRSASQFATQPREEFERLIANIGSGDIPRGDVVVTWEASRLHRDLEVYVQIRNACWGAGVLWCVNGRLFDLSQREDRRQSAYDAIQAEDEAWQISERVQRSLRANAVAGRPHGPGLYGYRRVYDAETGELADVVIDETQRDVVHRIIESVVEGRSLSSVADKLNREGTPAPRGGKWRFNQVRKVALNESYIGRRIHQGGSATFDAMWPPIVDKDLFYACKAVLLDAGRRTAHDTAAKYLVSGIAGCGRCGDAVRTNKHHSGRYRIYWCRENRHFSCRIDPVDAYATRLIVARFSQPDAAEIFAIHRDDRHTKKLLDDIARWRADLVEADELVKNREMSVARLASLEQRIQPEIDSAERKLAQARVNPLLATLIRPDPEEVYAEWMRLEITQHRAVVRAVFEWIKLHPMGAGRRNVDPAEYVSYEYRGPLPKA